MKLYLIGGVLWALLAIVGCTSIVPIASDSTSTTADSTPANCVPAAALDAYIQLRWERRVDQWSSIDAPKDAVVFLGSSIVEEGEWDALFPDTVTVNRGIGADTTQGVINRLDQIIALRPSKVFLYIGGNDFSRLGDAPESAIERLDAILATLRDDLPETKLFVHTLFPREKQHAPKIEAFNALLVERGGSDQTVIIDGYPWFLGTEGSIRPTFSNDRIHLSGEAYAIWADNIRSYVED